MKHSMIKKIGYLLTAVLFLFCCTSEKESLWRDVEKEEIQSFFKFESSQSRTESFTTDLIQVVINTLCKQGDLLDAIRTYRSKYGIPMWEHSVGVSVENGYQLFVPVYKKDGQDEIQTIWHFGIYDNKLYHFTLNRNPQSTIIEEYWKFDYFTTFALGKKPSSGLEFKELESRAAYKCVQTSVTVGEGEHAYTDYKGWYCWEIDDTVYFEENTEPDGGGGSGGFDSGVPVGGDGGTSGGGSNSSSGGNVAPKAQTIFRNSNMTNENWGIIENMLNKILKTCMGQNLYNALKEKLNGNTLTIQFVNDKISSFSFNGSTAGIKLSAEYMESNHLIHEMFHAYQAYQETSASYQNAVINLEIEAHYAQYLYLKRLKEYPDSKWEKGYKINQRLIGVANLKDYIDGHGRLLPNIPNDYFDLYLSMPLKEIFVKDKNYSNYSYDSSRYGTSNFQNLQTITENCGL